MRHRTLLLGAVLAATALAGCLGTSGGPAGPATDAPEPPGSSGEGPDAGPTTGPNATLTFPAGNGTTVHWANGTYEAQQACNTGGCLTGEAWRSEDVSGIVPAGVPVVLTAELTYDPGTPVFGDAMEMWFGASDATFYRYDYWEADDPGQIRINATVVLAGEGSVSAELFGTWPRGGQETSVDYTLQVTATPIPDQVPAGSPVEIALAPGQTLTAEAVGGDTVAYRLYGPDDEAVTRVTGEESADYTLPANASEGRYVVAVAADSANLTLRTDAADPSDLRALTLQFVVSDPTRYNGTGSASWSFDVDMTPVMAGIYVRDAYGGTPFGAGPWATADGFRFELTLPGGGSVSGTWECTPCLALIGSANLLTGTGFADPGSAPGTYEAQISSTAAVTWEYGHWTAWYAR